MPVAANWKGDTLLVFDVEQAKVSSYADAAVAGPDIRIAPEFISPVAASGEIEYVAVRADGSVLLKYPLRSSHPSADTAVQVVLAQRPGAGKPDTISSARMRVISWGGHSMIAQPASPQPRVAVGPNGWLATSAPDGTYRILVRDAKDRPVRQICRAIEPRPLSAAELGEARLGTPFEEPVAAIAKAAPPGRISHIGRMIMGPSGELLVDRQRPAPFTAEGLFGVAGSSMDVYDGSGAYLGEVQVPPGVSLQAVSGTFALGVQFSDFDEPWLISYLSSEVVLERRWWLTQRR